MCNNSVDNYIHYLVKRQDFITNYCRAIWGNTFNWHLLRSSTSKKKGIPKPWIKLRNMTTFDIYGFYVHDKFGMLFTEPTLGARGFLLIGGDRIERLSHKGESRNGEKENLWYKRITTSLPCRRQFPLIDILCQSLF